MTLYSHWYTVHDVAFTNGPLNYGPVSIGSGFKVTRIRVRGNLVSHGRVVGSADYLSSWLQHGLQHVAFGASPNNLEGGDFPPGTWFKAQGLPASNTGVAWAPDTDSAAFLVGPYADLTWHGQFYVSASIDIWYSIGRFTNAGIGVGFWGAIEVTTTG